MSDARSIFAPLDGLADDPQQPRHATPAVRKASQTKPSPGRWGLLNAFTDHGQARLSLLARVVWLTLFRNARNGTVQASMLQIAGWTERSERQIATTITELRSFRFVRQTKRGCHNSGPSRYTLCEPSQWREIPQVSTDLQTCEKSQDSIDLPNKTNLRKVAGMDDLKPAGIRSPIPAGIRSLSRKEESADGTLDASARFPALNGSAQT